MEPALKLRISYKDCGFETHKLIIVTPPLVKSRHHPLSNATMFGSEKRDRPHTSRRIRDIIK